MSAAFALSLVVAAPLMAQSAGRQGQQQAEPRHSAERTPQRDLSTSVRRVERESRGKVLSAEAMQFDGRVVNRIKVLDDRGRVRVYVDDPANAGRPRPTRDDDD